MLLVDARCTILPEREQDFIREVKKIIPSVRREAGCTRYELVSDAYVPGVFHFIEEWESQEHLDEHLQQPHMQEYFRKTATCHSSPTVLKIYEVISSRSMAMNR
ncbi:putative quinol monooxygenase [Methanoregula sp.]|uniref:putative quinol monooxygenase n=1 Tax=Methanoregula sp. TaxID=2052170 RepID=UPI0023764243|nr:putative quinol monooxygenase [Methanoregula sp.]MDD1686362.1 antibiotic biosynthesis monooxygenase [Methanoregula sp.]